MAAHRRPASERGFTAEVRARAVPADVLVLLAPPAVLLAVFALAEPVRSGLVYDRTEPELLAAFAAHYVHFEAAHLLGNLAVYALVVPPGYLLALLSGRRRWYLGVLAVVLGGFPLLLTGLDSAVIDRGILVGFSGLAMALVGVLPVALFGFLDERIDPAIGAEDAPVLFLAGLALVAVRAVPGREGLLLAAAAGALTVAYGGRLVRALPRPLGAAVRGWLGRSGYFELAVATPVLLAIAVWAAFPSDPVQGETVVNLLGHFLGYSLGFLGPYVAGLVADRLRREPPPSPPPDVKEPLEGHEMDDA